MMRVCFESFGRRLRWVIAASTLLVLALCVVDVRGQDTAKKPTPPTAVAIRGTPKIDGEVDDIWKNAPEVEVKKIVQSETTMPDKDVATGKVKLLWDADYLYALWHVTDAKLSARSEQPHEQDTIELFVDELNQKAGAYQKDDVQYRVSFEGKITGDGPEFKPENVKAATKKIEGGYLVEMSVKLSHAKREAGTKMGLELQINDDPNTGARGGVSKWNHTENDSYLSTADFGNLELKEKADN